MHVGHTFMDRHVRSYVHSTSDKTMYLPSLMNHEKRILTPRDINNEDI